ncbi:MAG TPA: hypothetical protein PKD50_07470, partial [Leptospiraceae bacterium]|nr:hypothetical protein [Leptospiraceae bacterium]
MFKLLFYFLFLFILSCKNDLNQQNTDLGFLSFLIRLSMGAVNTSNPIINPENDFYANDSLAPVLIARDRELGVKFGTEISSCDLEFNSTKITPIVRYASDTQTNYFSPQPGSYWPIDVVNPFTLKFSNCISKTGSTFDTSAISMKLYVAEKVIYIDGIGGVDTNSGTNTLPVKTIPAGISLASASCSDRCAIALKGGEYILNSGIIVPTNLSIFGGFDPIDWRKRRADKTALPPYDTIITDNSSGITSTGSDPYSTLKFLNYSGLQSKTVIDGIIVNGPTTANSNSYISPIGSVALTSGSGFIIRNTISNDRSTSALSITSAGFSSITSSGSILIQNSTLQASPIVAATSTRYGIVYASSVTGSSFTLETSIVNGGVSSVGSSGFFATGSPSGNILLSKNTIVSPDCSTICATVGVTMDFTTASGAIISDNTIQVTNGNNSRGISSSMGSGIQIKNNMIQVTGINSGSVFGISFGGTSSNQIVDGNTITTSTAGAGGVNKGIDINGSVSSINVLNNTINTGICPAASCARGIHKQNASNSTIVGNNITIGNCSNACDARVIDSAGGGSNTIQNNILSYGAVTSGNPATGIELNSGNFTIDGNTINGGTCTGSVNCTGINISAATNITITNNTITAGSTTGTGNQIGVLMGAAATSFTFTGNTISSGVNSGSPANRIALDLVNWPNNSTIHRNTFTNLSGSGNAIGVRFSTLANSLRFCSNLILAGNTTLGESVGINAQRLNGGAKFLGNTIVLGTASVSASGMKFVTNSSYDNMEILYNI